MSMGDLQNLGVLADGRVGVAERRVLLLSLAAGHKASHGRLLYAMALSDGHLEASTVETLFDYLTELATEEPVGPVEFAARADMIVALLSALAADPDQPRENLDRLLAQAGGKASGGEGTCAH